ncbi:MAG: hypothetical protein PWP59_1781 [Sphaerochaeta sp.]|nr:hypothetical protein [Sphaerochaeta sp.]
MPPKNLVGTGRDSNPASVTDTTVASGLNRSPPLILVYRASPAFLRHGPEPFYGGQYPSSSEKAGCDFWDLWDSNPQGERLVCPDLLSLICNPLPGPVPDSPKPSRQTTSIEKIPETDCELIFCRLSGCLWLSSPYGAGIGCRGIEPRERQSFTQRQILRVSRKPLRPMRVDATPPDFSRHLDVFST